MADRQQRMPQEHARTGVPHHVFHRALLHWPVAVNRTLATRGFFITERTLLQPDSRVLIQRLAGLAQRSAMRAVGVMTIDMHHRVDGAPVEFDVSRKAVSCRGRRAHRRRASRRRPTDWVGARAQYRRYPDLRRPRQTVSSPCATSLPLGVRLSVPAAPVSPARARACSVWAATCARLRSYQSTPRSLCFYLLPCAL